MEMIRCVLLVTVCATAFVLGQDDTDLKDVCYFGRPSRECLTKCQGQEKEPVCHETSGLCVCREKSAPASIHVQRVESPAEHLPDPKPEHMDVSTLHDMDPQESTPPPTEEPVILMKDYCFFGEYPSLACKSKCSNQGSGNLVAYCQDEAKNKTCLCREKTERDEEDVAVSPSTPDISNYCWFGEFPSSACHDKCGSDDAYCEQKHCLCKSQADALKPNEYATPMPEEEQGDESASSGIRHTIVLFLHKEGMEDLLNETDTDNETLSASAPTTPEQGQAEKNDTTMQTIIALLHEEGMLGNRTRGSESSTTLEASSQGRHSYWDYQHLAALAIAILVVLVIVLELYSYFSKRRASSLQSVFNTIPNQNQAVNKS